MDSTARTAEMPKGSRVRIVRGNPRLVGHTAIVQQEWPMQVALELPDGSWDVFSKGGLEPAPYAEGDTVETIGLVDDENGKRVTVVWQMSPTLVSVNYGDGRGLYYLATEHVRAV